MLLRFWVCAMVSILLNIRGIQAQCADPSPSGDCDQDGIINGLDSDADNDGILDLYECQDLVEESFQSSNGISVSFVFPSATTGIFIDLYALDNSFKINVNGTDLVDNELQFETAPSTAADSDLVFASDGTRHGRNGNPDVWNINGGPGDPIVRLKISADGQILILGKRFSNSDLEELIVQTGDPQLNNLTWNLTSENTVTISQEVVGPTYIEGQIFGLDCNNDTDGDGTPDYLDLNSDDDLCPDAIEGDDNLMNDDLLDNTAIAGGVNECGIPLALAPLGQGVGTSIDPNQMDPSCLSFTIDDFSPSCIGNDDGHAIINVRNGTGNYLYELIPGQIIQSSNEFTMLTAGNYTVIVTDPNSNFVTTLSFTISPSPYDCLTCQTTSIAFDCKGTSGSINVTPTGGIPPYCFSINGGQIQKDGLFENLSEGTYIINIQDDSGQSVSCDEEVDLIILPVTEIADRICFGDSVTIGSSVYFDAGRYVDTLQSATDCDSIISLNLEVSDLIRFDQIISLCDGEEFPVGANTYSASGNYTDTLQSVTGCDSVVATELNFFAGYEIDQEIQICEGDSFVIATNVYTSPGIYKDSLLSSSGCDSLVNTELQFFPMPGSNLEFSICEGDSIIVAQSVYYLAGNYSDTLQNQSGCDSIISTELTILFHSEFSQSHELCSGDSLAVGTSVYTMSRDHIDTLQNVRGCDSLVYSSLEFIEQIELTQEARLCPGEAIEVGANTYTSSGQYIDTLTSQRGCDSIVSTIVMNLESSEFFQELVLCYGEEHAVGSSTYNLSGNYIDTIENNRGCDSIIRTDLFIFEEIIYNQSVELCATDSIFVGTSLYQVAGMYSDSLLSSVGCDSIVNTALSFLPIEQRSESYSLCAGDSLELDIGAFVESGSTTFLIEEEGECDYELTINIELESEEICKIKNCKAYIPNAFSPDNDGMNDEFQPFSNAVTFTQMRIYDRWGSKVFESKKPNPKWDGTFQGKHLSPSVFVYLIEGVCKNGEEIFFAADLTLIR